MRQTTGGSSLTIDETYDLRGVDLVTPDEVSAPNTAAKADNARIYDRTVNDKRVALRTRLGSIHHTSPIGSTLDTNNTATVTGELAFTTATALAIPFTPTASKRLTRMDFDIRKDAGSYGPAIVEIYSDSAGAPGLFIGESSMAAADVTTSVTAVPVRFMDAPDVTSGTQYWAIVYIQDNGAGTYYLQKTASGNVKSTTDKLNYTPLSVGVHFKTYLSNPYPVKGFFRRYPSTGASRTLFAANDSVYSADNLGNVTTLDTTLSTSSSKVRFAHINDQTVWVNGINNPRYWDGTTVADLAGAPAGARNVLAHQGRLFFLLENALVKFTNLYDFTTIPSVNFFYVPDPKSADRVSGWLVFQDNMLIFTRKTKHIVYGSDISSFTRKEAVGTLGAVSQEAIAADKSYVYFMAADKMIYRWNGADDQLLSARIENELQGIGDPSLVRIHLYRDQLRVYYPSPGNTYNDKMALLDLTYSNPAKRDFQWVIDTGRDVCGSLAWDQDNNELIEFSSRVAQLYFGEQGTSDMGKAIDFKYWTTYKTYGSAAAKKRIKIFHPILETAAEDYTMSIGKDIDYANNPTMKPYAVNGGGAKWGAFVWGDGTKWGRTNYIDNKVGMSGRGKHIQYRFERKGVDTPVYLLGYHAQVKVGRPR